MRAWPLAALLLASAASAGEKDISDSIRRLKTQTAARGQRPAGPTAGLCRSREDRDCFIESDIERVPGLLYRHRGGWLVEQACMDPARTGGKPLAQALDKAFAKLDPDAPGSCLGRYNRPLARQVAGLLDEGRVLILCTGTGKGCAHNSVAHRYRGRFGADGSFTRTSPVGQKFNSIGLEDLAACPEQVRQNLDVFVFHETLHAADLPISEPGAHVWGNRDPKDLVYSTQDVCFSQPSGPQCRAVVQYRNPGGNATLLCNQFGLQ